jgi:putative ABC transport system permease protein
MNFYRLLLHLYPSSFRAQYGEEMSEIFALGLSQKNGLLFRCGLWLSALAEVLANAAALHWEITRRDLYHSARSLLRSPGFALTAILLVTVGVGANVAVFTLTDFVLVRPLPFPHPEQLMKVWEAPPGYPRMELSPANYRDIVAANTSFSELAAFNPMSASMVGQGEPQRVQGAWVTANLLPTLQRPVLMGRSFTPKDDQKGAPGTVVLSYALWQTTFGGDDHILGKAVSLDNESYTVIGVMPYDFHFPTRETQFWSPFRFWGEDYKDRNNNYLEGLGRLKPGVMPAQAQNELSLIAARLRGQYPKEMEKVGISAVAMRDELSNQSRLLLKGLCGAALCVLIIACANLANLLLARSLARQRDLSIRLSLGASRRILLRQLLTESLLLGSIGGASAIALATAALPLLARLVPNGLPIQQVPSVDAHTLLFALGLTLFTIIAFSVAPALQACRGAGLNGLRIGVRTAGGGHQRARSALVIAEVGASIVLLVLSGLLLRALWKVQSTDPGFRTSGILSLRTELPFPKYNSTKLRSQFYEKVIANVRNQPGVLDAAYVTASPMTWAGGIWPVQVEGQSEIRAQGNVASMRFVTPGAFSTLGIPLKAGRSVSESDMAERPWVAVVSESFVHRYWPNEQPLGKHFKFGFHDHEVIGIVADIRVRGLERTSEPQVYLSYKQDADDGFTGYAPKDLVIYSKQPPATLLPAVRQIIHQADPEQPISQIRTIEEVVAGQTESRALQMHVLMIFTAVSIFLAGLGIYGLLSFAVAMRQQEFGVRMALGAQKADIFKMVFRQGAGLALAGLLPGLGLAYLAARLLQSLLAGVQPADRLTFAASASICLLTALLGSLVPALRAVKADPAAVMRAE